VRVGVVVVSQPPEVGGGFVFSWEILRALCELAGESSHDYILLADPDSLASVRSLISTPRVTAHALPAAGLVMRAKEALWRHSSIARVWLPAPGWVQRHADALALDFLWFLSPACHFLQTPYAAIVWDLQHRTLPWFSEVSADGQWETREAMNRLFLPRASVVIAGTEAGAAEITGIYGVPRGRILLLPHPTPRYALDFAIGADVALPPGLRDPLIIYPAQFWAHKNHAVLLKAMVLLRERYGIRASLALTGSDKGNRAHCELLARELGIADAVHFLGFVPERQLIGLYRRAAALAYVSYGGPENLPPLEAFALGCPVVAADVPGAREQLGDAALLVDPVSADAVAVALARIIGDQDLASNLRARGRKRAEERTAAVFVRGMFAWLDRFAVVRAAWPGSSPVA
jgi:glycosyltransferase involved in cell wall biosynthesis